MRAQFVESIRNIIVILALFGAATATLVSQGQGDLCEVFNRESLGPWREAAEGVETSLLPGGPDGENDFFLLADDLQHASIVVVPSAQLAAWNDFLRRGCGAICWDSKVFDDGDQDVIRDLHPTIGIAGAGFRASFVADLTMTEPGGAHEGWHRTCAPLRATEDGMPPQAEGGAWKMAVGDPSDWNALVAQLSRVVFPIFDIGKSQNEQVGFDNICLESRPCQEEEEEEEEESCGATCCQAILELLDMVRQDREPEAFLYLSTDEHVTGQTITFWPSGGPGRPNSHSGNKCDLDDREIEYNDEAKSALLHGPPGTSVTLFGAKGCSTSEATLVMTVPAGATECRVTSFDPAALPPCASLTGGGLRGKVSGLRWN